MREQHNGAAGFHFRSTLRSCISTATITLPFFNTGDETLESKNVVYPIFADSNSIAVMGTLCKQYLGYSSAMA